MIRTSAVLICAALAWHGAASAQELNARDHPDPAAAARLARDAAEAHRLRKELHLNGAKAFVLDCLGGSAVVTRRDGTVVRDDGSGNPVVIAIPGNCR